MTYVPIIVMNLLHFGTVLLRARTYLLEKLTEDIHDIIIPAYDSVNIST